MIFRSLGGQYAETLFDGKDDDASKKKTLLPEERIPWMQLMHYVSKNHQLEKLKVLWPDDPYSFRLRVIFFSHGILSLKVIVGRGVVNFVEGVRDEVSGLC